MYALPPRRLKAKNYFINETCAHLGHGKREIKTTRAQDVWNPPCVVDARASFDVPGSGGGGGGGVHGGPD